MSEAKHIKVGYDDSAEQRIPVNHRRAKAAFGLAAIVSSLYMAGHANHGNHSEDVPASPAQHGVAYGEHTVSKKADSAEPKTITYRVGKKDTADGIGDKFTDNYTDLKAVSQDVVSAEPNAPVLHRGDELQVSTEHMDPTAVADYEAHNSAQH